MTLFEVTTGKVGESYVRCYVWARDNVQVHELFKAKHPNESINGVKPLFGSDALAFVTQLSDCGFADLGGD